MADILIQALEISAINDAICIAVDVATVVVYKTAEIVGEVTEETSKIVKFVRKFNASHRIAGRDPLQFKQQHCK